MPMSPPRLLLALLVLTAMQVTSQVTPSSWRKPNITTPLTERVRLAGAALDTAIDRLGTDGFFATGDLPTATGDLYSQMALFDMATNQSKYESALGQYFEPANSLAFGHAALHAYTAYNKNPTFLQYAIESWSLGRRFTLSAQDVAAGKFAGKNFTLSKVCHNATMAGGTFENNKPGDVNIEGYATGYFLVLSALLAEATGDPVYLAAANQTASFIHTQLYNVQNVVQSYMSASTSIAPCNVSSSTNPVANESGLMIEGLAVLAAVTGSKDTLELLNQLLVTVTSNTGWQRENGILAEGDKASGDMNVLRGLGTVYSRNLTTPAMRQYVGDYIGVQFNAVVDLATSNGTDIYGDSWTGPPSGNFSGLNQTDALGALISAIYLGSTDESESTTTAPNPVPHRKHNVGAIVGGTIGGVLALAMLGLVLLWVHKRRGRARRPDAGVPEALLVYEPFTGTGHSTTTTASFVPSAAGGFSHSHSHSVTPPFGASAVSYPREKNLPPPPVPEMQQVRVSAPPPPPPQQTQDDPVPPMATERLISLLSERLQGERHEEAPPRYPFSDVGSD